MADSYDQSYGEWLGKPQPAYQGSQSKSPKKEDITSDAEDRAFNANAHRLSQTPDVSGQNFPWQQQ